VKEKLYQVKQPFRHLVRVARNKHRMLVLEADRTGVSQDLEYRLSSAHKNMQVENVFPTACNKVRFALILKALQ
jgi:hypothetical protein